MNMKVIDILLVEDNEGDIRLTEEAFRDSKIKNHVYVARDGVEALEFLQKQGKHKDVPTPDFILLDLNLPRKDGRELLGDIKNDPKLHRIPVVILTTSTAEADVLKTYDLHANCYITKPVDFEQFVKVVRQIEDFWFTIVCLPKV